MSNIYTDTKMFRILRDRIIFAEYYPGQVLPNSELAEAVGVNATPITEAVVCLENEGLVHRVPNSSARVKEIGLQDLRSIFELRLILVEQVGILAAQRIDEAELEKLQDLLKKFAGARKSINVMQLDAQLHDVVYDAIEDVLAGKLTFTEALANTPKIQEQLSAEAVTEMLDPSAYTGLCADMGLGRCCRTADVFAERV